MMESFEFHLRQFGRKRGVETSIESFEISALLAFLQGYVQYINK